jgi:HAD superfamily hydrolase (TIGR01490 family)
LTQRFAIYDLDRTITRLPTWSRFLLYAARRRAPWRVVLIPLLGVAALLRTAWLIDRDRLKEIMHRLMIGRTIDPATLAALSDAFAAGEDAANVFRDARAQLAADRAAGYTLVLATAAHGFYAVPIAARLGIHHVIATQAVHDHAGRITSRIAGDNCYGAAKHRAIAVWLDARADRQDAHVRFYSDHLTDLPTLDWADVPVVVNPGPALRRIAAARQWDVRHWTTVGA